MDLTFAYFLLMWFSGRQQQQGGEDQGGRWDVSHQLQFSRMLNAVVMVVDMKVVYTFNQSNHIKNMRVDVDNIVDEKTILRR